MADMDRSMDDELSIQDGQVDKDAGPAELPPDQQRALEMMLMGKPLGEVAAAIGVGRTTLYEWRKKNRAFIATMKLWNDELAQIEETRLRNMADQAVRAMEKAFTAGDGKLALRYFEWMAKRRKDQAKEAADPDASLTL